MIDFIVGSLFVGSLLLLLIVILLKLKKEKIKRRNKEIQFIESITNFIKYSSEIDSMDGKRLLHLILLTGMQDKNSSFGLDGAIWKKIETILYPEYDGENVYWNEWGWKIKDGVDIVYDNQKYIKE